MKYSTFPRLHRRILAMGLFAACFVSQGYAQQSPTQTSISGDEIVRQCDNKYPGEDQRSQLTIKLTDQAGNERRTVYLRLWKDYKGAEDVADKMVLFTMYPPDAKGAAFMRTAFSPDTGKSAEQLIYLPVLRKIRRVSVRDLSDSFLGSDLTYGDITLRRPQDDTHHFVRIDHDKQGRQYFVVESVPKENDSLYSKKVSWYSKTPDMGQCVKIRVDYYDKKGSFLKRQLLQWQQVDKAWVWDRVLVQNVQTLHTSFFEVSQVKINVGLKDDMFTERRLRLGIK